MKHITSIQDIPPVSGDFHTHSDLSDGTESPLELARAAKQAGLSVIALTDHNRLDVELADELRRESGVFVIPACEFSASVQLPGQGRLSEIHVIGLFLRETEAVRQVLRNNHLERKPYVIAWLKALDRFGIDLSPARDRDLEQSYQQLVRENANSTYLGRAAIANRMVELGFAASTGEAYHQWLGREPEDRKLIQIYAEDYVSYVPLPEVMSAIRGCPGAVAVLCHPFYHIPEEQVEWLVREFARLDGDAMEVYYGSGQNAYSQERQAYLMELAWTYGLLPSAGSDRHGPLRPFQKSSPEVVRRIMQRHMDRLSDRWNKNGGWT